MDLYTNRLKIRPVNINDSKSIFKYRSNPETNKYLSFIPQSIEDVNEFIRNTSKEINIQGTWFQFVIIEKSSKSIIGDIGLHFLEIDSSNKQTELGITLNKDFSNKGYAAEALKSTIDYLIKHLKKHRIIASVDPKNINSIKLFEKLGFRKEAHFKKSLFFHGEWVDDVIYAILADEWN